MTTNTISFMSANFVARELGYRMTGGWGEGDRATNAAFAPLETFPARFGAMLGEVQALGFGAIDLWLAHLHPSWATDEHVAVARELLACHNLRVASLAGGLGATPAEVAATCWLATALGTDLLGGLTPLLASDRPALVGLLEEHDLRLGLENHPERTPDEMLAKIGDGGGGRIGTAVDTGWYATHGFDAARAIEALGGHIVHVHLKDVRAAGGHETVPYGEGIVPLERCVRALQGMGYAGGYSVEHEPEDHDPRPACAAGLRRLAGWLDQAPPAAPPAAGARG